MMNKFNPGVVKQLLQEENQFLCNIFSRMPLSTPELLEDKGEKDEELHQQNNPAKSSFVNKNAQRALTSEELHQKFNELKGRKKLNYKQKQLKKGLKNRIKKKSKRDERVMAKKVIKTELNSGEVALDDRKDVEIASRISRVKPVFNSEGHMVFSKFDFSDMGNKKKSQKTEKDPKKILEQLKQKKNSLKELAASGEIQKATAIQEKDAWKAALAKAGGEKIKDDPELLKRTIKRDTQQKKRSAKKWESRMSGVGKAQQEKQRKRTENIMKKKKERKITKMKKASKHGRIIPGF